MAFKGGKTCNRLAAHQADYLYVESNGRIFLYDEQLSIIRVNAARANKRPGISWSDIERAVKSLDLNNELNQYIIKELKTGRSEPDITKAVEGMIRDRLLE